MSLNKWVIITIIFLDDGSLSLEEFQTYFADEGVSKAQLNEIFATIDTHKTKSV